MGVVSLQKRKASTEQMRVKISLFAAVILSSIVVLFAIPSGRMEATTLCQSWLMMGLTSESSSAALTSSEIQENISFDATISNISWFFPFLLFW